MSPEALGSRYLLDERIGQGGMGAVWRGRDRETGTHYAIKVLRPDYAGDPAAVARFVRERTALLSLRHPNVVTVHDMIVEGDRLALVMDLITGGDLIDHQRRRGGKLSPPEAADVTAQICDALAVAHSAGIVHRDLKPANILVDGDRFVLADFGIARIAGHPASTTTGAVLGTVPFLAPEVISGHEPTAACDVYAMGVTLYEMLAGTPPFTGNMAAVIHDHLHAPVPRPAGIPDALWDVISDCLGKDPAARSSAAAVAQTIRAIALPADPALGAEQALWQPAPRPPGQQVPEERAPTADVPMRQLPGQRAQEQRREFRPLTSTGSAAPGADSNGHLPAARRGGAFGDPTHAAHRQPAQGQPPGLSARDWDTVGQLPPGRTESHLNALVMEPPGDLPDGGPGSGHGGTGRRRAVPGPSGPDGPPGLAVKRSRRGRVIMAAAAALVALAAGTTLMLTGYGPFGSAPKASSAAGLTSTARLKPDTAGPVSKVHPRTKPTATPPGGAGQLGTPAQTAGSSTTSPASPSTSSGPKRATQPSAGSSTTSPASPSAGSGSGGGQSSGTPPPAGLPTLDASASQQAHQCTVLGSADGDEAVVCADILTGDNGGQYYAEGQIEAYCQNSAGEDVQCANVTADGGIYDAANGASADVHVVDCGHAAGPCSTGRNYAITGELEFSPVWTDLNCTSSTANATDVWSLARGTGDGGDTTIELPGSDMSFSLTSANSDDSGNQSTAHNFVCP